MDPLRVSYFWRGLRDEVQLLCRYLKPLSYMDLLIMELGIEDDQASIKKLATTWGGYSG